MKRCKELRDCPVIVLVTDDIVLQDGEVTSPSADNMESLRARENKAHSGSCLTGSSLSQSFQSYLSFRKDDLSPSVPCIGHLL